MSDLFDNDAQLYARLCIGQLEDELKCNGDTTGTDVEVVLLFLLPVLELIRKMTNQAINLHNMDVASLELYELVQFVAVMLLSHFSNYAFKLVIKDMNERNFITPTLERLRWIQHNFKLYSPSQRGDTKGTQNWRSLRDRTHHLDEFESILFDTIRKCFVHPDHMAITLDDESFGCRAKDNQVKKLNPRKADKEGYACDALADCYFRIPLGLRFSRRGESQEKNVETLMQIVFKTGATSGGTSLLGADRGFARFCLAEFAARHGLGTVLIFPDHLVNAHPFLSKVSYTNKVKGTSPGNEYTLTAEQKQREKKANEFLIDDDPLFGPLAMTSTKQLEGSTIKHTAVVAREDGDKDHAKVLRFSFTNLGRRNIDAETLKQWVLIPHRWGSRKDFIYGHLFTKDPRLEALLEHSDDEGVSYVATPEKSGTNTDVSPSSFPSIDERFHQSMN